MQSWIKLQKRKTDTDKYQKLLFKNDCIDVRNDIQENVEDVMLSWKSPNSEATVSFLFSKGDLLCFLKVWMFVLGL